MVIRKSIRGDGRLPSVPSWGQVLRGFFGSVIAVAVLGILTKSSNLPFLIAPLGASCFLLFAAPDAPFSQPRNVIAGHLLSSAIGLLFSKYIGVGAWAMGIAVGAAISVMLITRTSHPPAGADPLLVMITGNLSWKFLITPVVASTVLLVIIAFIINNAGKDKTWPRYWY